MRRFLFYDLETTGLNKSFDQILQFAAIRCDETLKEIDRYSIRVKLRPDVIPSPRASITHRIAIEDNRDGLSEFEAVRHIHALMNTPGTISLGYNTLGFDDEFLRFSFHRNLLPPYTHQYANHCSRMDLLPVTVLYYLYKPDVISWPDIDGKPTLKLEYLSKENGLAQGQAHDAMVDVEATVELARRFIRRKDMWDYVTGYFSKPTDQDRISKLPSAFDSPAGMHLYGIMTGSRFGPDSRYQAPVLYLGESIPYKNQSLWLRLDTPDVRNVSEDGDMDHVRVFRKRMGEPDIILPPLKRFTQHISAERKSEVTENLAWLRQEKSRFYKIVSWFCEYRYPDVDHVDADASLYLEGFPSREEQALCRTFHQKIKTEGAKAVSVFEDGSLKTRAMRVLFRNFPGHDFGAYTEDHARHMEAVNPGPEQSPMMDFRGEKRMTPIEAMKEIQVVRNEGGLDEGQAKILDELETYLINVFPDLNSN